MPRTPITDRLCPKCEVFEDEVHCLTSYDLLTTDRDIQYITRNMHTVFALLCFVVVIYWLIFPYQSGWLHWHCGNLTIAPVPAKQPWWIWINTSCEFIMNDCITTTKQSTTKPCAYFLGYTVLFSRITTMSSDFQTLANHEKSIFMLCYPDREFLAIVGKFIHNCFQERNSLV